MKNKISIIIAILALNINLSYGKTRSSDITDNPVVLSSPSEMLYFAPVTPKEATFDDGMAGYEEMIPLHALAPETPCRATFEDSDIPQSMNDHSIAPSTQKETSFEPGSNSFDDLNGTFLKRVSPSAPREADFTDDTIN